MPADTLLTSNSALTLGDLTSPALITPRLRGQDATSVIQELGETLAREAREPDLQSFQQAVLKREHLGGTSMEAGMAFPHARLAELKELSFALGRSDVLLSWNINEVPSVRLVFLIAVPANDSARYLSLISGLARLAKDRPLVERILTAHDAAQIFEILRQVNLRASSETLNPVRL